MVLAHNDSQDAEMWTIIVSLEWQSHWSYSQQYISIGDVITSIPSAVHRDADIKHRSRPAISLASQPSIASIAEDTTSFRSTGCWDLAVLGWIRLSLSLSRLEKTSFHWPHCWLWVFLYFHLTSNGYSVFSSLFAMEGYRIAKGWVIYWSRSDIDIQSGASWTIEHLWRTNTLESKASFGKAQEVFANDSSVCLQISRMHLAHSLLPTFPGRETS